MLFLPEHNVLILYPPLEMIKYITMINEINVTINKTKAD